ncbi:hypothetical protein QJV45_02705 [Listeria booriae]|uniref:hypothetical protein n=1 Tax=Listeria booriae TaxID=1552123 RepID=UPI0028809F3A|nr:hypothetical protein [Listeria booriae]MDT0109353.1 hypothetical protein [Listeria booriae]
MNYKQTHDLMRKAVPLARKLDGDWSVRMKMALREIVIRHYLEQPLTNTVVEILLAKGCSLRRICKHYGVSRHHLKKSKA